MGLQACKQRDVHRPTPGTPVPGSVSGACGSVRRSPWSRPLAPPTPPPLARRCSQASQLLRPSLTSPVRSSLATAPRLPNAGHAPAQARVVKLEISRFPSRERMHMPGSATTPGRAGTCVGAPSRIAFHYLNSVGTRDRTMAAQWLAYAHPCQRFAPCLTARTRMTRGQRDSPHLHRQGLPPFTLCRSPGALRSTI